VRHPFLHRIRAGEDVAEDGRTYLKRDNFNHEDTNELGARAAWWPPTSWPRRR